MLRATEPGGLSKMRIALQTGPAPFPIGELSAKIGSERGEMRCSVCGHESPPGSSFCLNCGSALVPAQTPAIAAGLPAAGVICPLCRGENPPGMKFCRNCGTGLGQEPDAGAPLRWVHR